MKCLITKLANHTAEPRFIQSSGRVEDNLVKFRLEREFMWLRIAEPTDTLWFYVAACSEL